MYKNLTKFTSLILVGLLLFTVSCKDDEVTPEGKTIVELALETPEYSTLVEALTKADLVDVLNGTTAYTVFAPDNDAFDALFSTLGVDGIEDLTKEQLDPILKYHLVAGQVFSSDLMTQSYVTVNGAEIDVDLSSGVKINGVANVINPFDTEASNGAIHTINAVLLPPTPGVVATAGGNPDLSILVEALSKFPTLVAELNAAENQTVFAPTNDAFVALLGAIGQSSLDDIPEDVLRNILEYHVISGANILSTDLTDGQEATADNGEVIDITINQDGVFIEGAKVGTANVETGNGIVHVVESVLVPKSVQPIVGTIVAPAYFNKSFTTLIAAVQAADEDILSVLLGDGPSGNGMTLFAPTNDAFTAAGITSLPDGATLSAVLKYHLVDAIVKAEDIAAGSSTAGAVGGDFYLSNNGEAGIFINGTSQVIANNIEGSNGVVHVINQTLLPASNNIVEIALASGFNKLAEALVEAGLDQTLAGAGNYTVFAPTDAAFSDLYTALGVDGPSEIDDALLEDVLLYHVIGTGRVFSTDLSDGLNATTLSDAGGSGTTFEVKIGTGVELNDLDPDFANPNVTATNILATNGVIHVIDAVLLPADL